jgi:hypothetical protein
MFHDDRGTQLSLKVNLLVLRLRHEKLDKTDTIVND